MLSSFSLLINILKSILRWVSFIFKNNAMSLSVFKTVLDRLSPQFAMDQSDWLSRLEGRRYAFPAKVVL